MEFPVLDKVFRELTLIDKIFTVQRAKVDDVQAMYDGSGRPINGRYIHFFQLLTDDSLFDLYAFKEYAIRRYETASNTSILLSQLADLKKYATFLKEYYLTHLSENNILVNEAVNKIIEFKVTPIYYSAVIVTHQHSFAKVFFGVNKFSSNFKIQVEKEYWIPGNNDLLYKICDSIVNIVSSIEGQPLKDKDMVIEAAKLRPLSLLENQRQVSLYYFYKGIAINKREAAQIFKLFPWTSFRSLRQVYNKVTRPKNRILPQFVTDIAKVVQQLELDKLDTTDAKKDYEVAFSKVKGEK